MKTVLYYSNTDGCYIMTSEQNYRAYIQNERDKHILTDVKTPEQAYQFIEKACKWWNAKPEEFEVIWWTSRQTISTNLKPC